MKNNSVCLSIIQIKSLLKMPGNSLSLTVLIGSKPYGLCLGGKFFQIRNHLLLICRDLIARLKTIIYIYA